MNLQNAKSYKAIKQEILLPAAESRGHSKAALSPLIITPRSSSMSNPRQQPLVRAFYLPGIVGRIGQH